MYYISNVLVPYFDVTLRNPMHFKQASKCMYGINRNEEKTCLRGFQNLTIQPHKTDRGLKIRNYEEERFDYLCSESKGIVQLCGFQTAGLRLCFRVSHDVAHV